MDTDLHKHSKEDDGDGSREEHVSPGEMSTVQEVNQRERDRSPQAAVSDDKLVFSRQFHNTKLVDHKRQADDTWRKSGHHVNL